jgi:hypothetical protein
VVDNESREGSRERRGRFVSFLCHNEKGIKRKSVS